MGIEESKALRLTFNPRRGPVNEEPISNQQFLSSFLDYGVWLRALAAHTHLQQIEVNKENRLQKFAATMAFYQQVGLAAEDIFTNLIAWSIWSQDKDQRLPDLMERLMLRFGPPKELVGAKYADEIRHAAVSTQKKISIYPVEYLASLMSIYRNEIVMQFGVPWKKNPSVKLVPRNMLDKWNDFPNQLLQSLEYLIQPANIELTSTHNKLKHGPQIVVTNPLDSCIARGLVTEHIRNLNFPDEETMDQDLIRMLFHGSRTQETSEEDTAQDAAAPYLTGEIVDARDFFHHVVFHYANILFFVGTWIYNSTYPTAKREHWAKHEVIQRILGERTKARSTP